MRLILTALVILSTSLQMAQAQGRDWIGTGSMFTNDFIGDRGDRWRTGSFTYSHLHGKQPYDGQSQGYGDILEYRLRTEIITPAGGTPRPGDRPYVGALSLAVNTHFMVDSTYYTLGVEATAIGPQTGLAQLQRDFHERFSLPQAPFVEDQLGDQFAISANGEAAHQRMFGDSVSVRTFAGFEVGAEDLVRIGADMRYSLYGHDDLMLRDVVTGQLHPGTANDGTGFALIVGADVAHVIDSVYFPDVDQAGIDTTRFRARAGVDYKFTETASAFYGVTYLSPEFEGQPEGQVLGSLRLNFNF